MFLHIVAGMPKKPATISAKDHRRLLPDAVKLVRSELRHMTQDSLAQAVGLDPSLISRYEKGTAFASYDAMYKIAAALGVSIDAISYPVHWVYVPSDSEPAA